MFVKNAPVVGFAIAAAAALLTPSQANASCNGDPNSPITVSTDDQIDSHYTGMVVQLGKAYDVVEKGSGRLVTTSTTRCLIVRPDPVESALADAVRDICDPTKSVNVNFDRSKRLPTQQEFETFCRAAGYPNPGNLFTPKP